MSNAITGGILEIRKLAAPDGGRVETGAVQHGDDWPGLFIRGDNCAGWFDKISNKSLVIDESVRKDLLILFEKPLL